MLKMLHCFFLACNLLAGCAFTTDERGVALKHEMCRQ